MLFRKNGGNMYEKAVRVLIACETSLGFSLLSQHLEAHGGECWFASSHSEAARLFLERPFDLVLCSDRIAGIQTLIASLVGSSASLFCCHGVETGCWWLPGVLHGEKCLGAPALRPGEFAKVLDQLMDELAATEHCQALAVAV
jgi:hypothetical protein